MASLTEYIAGKQPSKFQLQPRYIPEGDCLIFYWYEDESYGHRVDELLTIYRSIKTDAIVGCEIKGVSRIRETIGTFGLSYHEGKVEFGVVLMGYAITAEQTPPSATMAELGRTAGSARVPLIQDTLATSATFLAGSGEKNRW